MALIAGASPRVGALTLEVENEEEIREQRTLFVVNGALFLAIGLFLGALTLGYGETPILTRPVAGTIAVVAALTAIACNVLTFRLIDELVLSITKDATLMTSMVMLLTFGCWAAAAILGVAPMFSPLLGLAGFFAIYLGCTMVIWHRRDLLS